MTIIVTSEHSPSSSDAPPTPEPLTEAEIRADERARVVEEHRLRDEADDRWTEITRLQTENQSLSSRVSELEGMVVTPVAIPTPAEVDPSPIPPPSPQPPADDPPVTALEVEEDPAPEPGAPSAAKTAKPNHRGLWW